MKFFKNNEIPESIDGIDVAQNEFIALKEYLAKNEKVVRFEYGDSMSPLLISGQFCLLTPLQDNEEVNIGDIVFSAIGTALNTHMVIMKSTKNGKPYYLIGDSNMRPLGWTDHVFAKAEGIPYAVQEQDMRKKYVTNNYLQPTLSSYLTSSTTRFSSPDIVASHDDASHEDNEIECVF